MGLRNRWLSKEGLKGAVVGVVVFVVFVVVGCCNLWIAEAVVVGLLIKPHYLKLTLR